MTSLLAVCVCADTSLVLTTVTLQQRGMYQCVARNSLGMAQAAARLIVTPSSANTLPANQDSGGTE